MRVVQLNLAWDASVIGSDELLDRYHTLTGWSTALTSAGATVHVVQRFMYDTTVVRDGVSYELVRDGPVPMPPPWRHLARATACVRRLSPDVVHVNGLMFPGALAGIREAAGDSATIVLQDHSGALPQRYFWPLGHAAALRWSRAFRHADACSFTARELARRWHATGLPEDMPLLEIPEASTTVRALGDARFRQANGKALSILWVGRVDGNKDPVTVLDGFHLTRDALPYARLTMIVGSAEGRGPLEAHLRAQPARRERVTVTGPVAHADMAKYYSDADLYVSGSHHEGSGYALIEAMACDVIPCVTDIPAFRALTSGCGVLWRAGDPAALAAALREIASCELGTLRTAVRRRFDDALTWHAIGARTFEAYAGLLTRRRATL